VTHERTQVAIVGAGPAGLTLGQLLHRAGIAAVVLENRSREYVEARIRAGVLEQGTVDLLERAGVSDRLRREGIVHHGIYLQFDGERHHVPLSELTGGRSIVIYGQTEVVKDLVAARLAAGLPLHFEVANVGIQGYDGDDSLRGGAGDDKVYGDPGSEGVGNDEVDGDEGDDILRGAAGNDRIVGGSGEDILDGGTGDDNLLALDGEKDTVAGGPGTDHARADQHLDVISRVESVTFS